MNKLSIIRNALQTNPEVIIISEKKENYLPNTAPWSNFCQTVDFYVAPKNGLYTAIELQQFMMGLIPDLKQTQKDDFRHDDDTLNLGKLYFDEKVGEQRSITKRILTVTDEDLLNLAGFVNGEQTINHDVTEDYARRTWVRPFPNEAYAQDVLNGRLIGYRINHTELRTYKPHKSLYQRLTGK